MLVGVCRIKLYFPECGSLKAKRHNLRRIVERTKAKFNAAVAEVSGQDSWQRADIGVVVVGNETPHVQSMLDNIVGFVEQMYVGQVMEREIDLLSYNDQESLGE
ncbi:MAG: DUF503 domain-containing protein [Pseudomonadota bacterium]